MESKQKVLSSEEEENDQEEETKVSENTSTTVGKKKVAKGKARTLIDISDASTAAALMKNIIVANEILTNLLNIIQQKNKSPYNDYYLRKYDDRKNKCINNSCAMFMSKWSHLCIYQ